MMTNDAWGWVNRRRASTPPKTMTLPFETLRAARLPFASTLRAKRLRGVDLRVVAAVFGGLACAARPRRRPIAVRVASRRRET